jgi:hypothetical protein
MRFFKYLALLSLAALMFASLAEARSTKNERTLKFSDPVQIGTVHLKPGTYKVEWQNAGPNVKVTFLRNNKTIATAPAKLKLNQDVPYNEVVTDHAHANQSMLREIDFSHGKEALVFGQGA